ncbi:hypothetical protein V5799_004175 [Amblyomma americanum]|uniref:Peptidase M13 N-terminal domain-containing protein n=1 Tax=Amblyomma americanum TaxID=6943 RepID=A0AAQ4D6V7_AMBAM
MTSRRSSSDKRRHSGTRSRRRRHRRPPKDDDIPEAETQARDGRGQTSESPPPPSETSAVTTTHARGGGGSYTQDASPAPPPEIETPGTGPSIIRSGTRDGTGQTSDSPRPAGGSALMATRTRSDGSSEAPDALPTPADVEAPGARASSIHTKTRGGRRQTSGSHHRATVSATMTTRSGSEGSSVSPDMSPKPGQDAEASGTGAFGTCAGTRDGKGQAPDSPRRADGSSVSTIAKSHAEPTLPHESSTVRPDVEATIAESHAGPTLPQESSTVRPDVEAADAGARESKKAPSSDNGLPTQDTTRPSGAVHERIPVGISPPTVITPSLDDVGPSIPAVRDFDGAQLRKLDHIASSPHSRADWNLSPPYSSKTLVRFGATTLREFVPLTTLTEKVARSPRLYGTLGALVSLACVYLVVTLWTRGSRERHSECTNAECRDAQAYLDSLLDRDVEPCNDFYRHVCRKWRVQNTDGATVAAKAAKELVGALHTTLLERARRHRGSSHAEDLLVHFYLSCNDFAASTRVIIGRPLAGVYQSHVDVLRLPDTAATLRRAIQLSLCRGISTLFSVRIVRLSDKVIALYVSPGKTLAEKFSHVATSSTLTAYIREALEQASTTEASVPKSNIDTTIYELLKFDNEIVPVEVALPVAETVNASHFAVLIRQGHPGLWLEFINSLLPASSKLSEQSPVMSHHLGLVREAVQYLSKNHQIGLLYIFLHTLADVGRFYYSNRFAKEADVICLTASQEVMGPGWFNVFASLIRELSPISTRVGDIFASVRNLSSRHVLEFGLDDAAKKDVRATLDGVTLLADYESLRPVSTSNGSGPYTSNHTAGFAGHYTSLKALEAERRLQDPPSLKEILLTDSLFSGDTTYTRLLNAVLLPPAVRRPPLMYSTRVPLEFDMGTIGVLLSTGVFHAGVPPPASSESWYIQNVKKFVDCVQHSTGSATVTVSQGLELFAWARAVMVAYDVMKDAYAAIRSQKRFEHLWITAQQTFFRRFCLMTCSVGNVGLESRLRCLVPVLTMVEFADAFKCHASAVTRTRDCGRYENATRVRFSSGQHPRHLPSLPGGLCGAVGC